MTGRRRFEAVFFDVDFTLIYPGPTFQGAGYQQFCTRRGVSVDPTRFDAAVAHASSILDEVQEHIYSPQLFVDFTSAVIVGMGGEPGAALTAAARDIYDEWATNQHFLLYDDAVPALRRLRQAGLRVGLISNSHRCLASFQSHFELDGLIAGALSSSDHGLLKPHPSIFRAALALLDAAPDTSVMVGDSVKQDIDGALGVGMHAILVRRSGAGGAYPDKVPVIANLGELDALLHYP